MTNAKNNDKVTSILGFKVCLVLWYSWGWQMAKYLKRHLEHKKCHYTLKPLGLDLVLDLGLGLGMDLGLDRPGKGLAWGSNCPGKGPTRGWIRKVVLRAWLVSCHQVRNPRAQICAVWLQTGLQPVKQNLCLAPDQKMVRSCCGPCNPSKWEADI